MKHRIEAAVLEINTAIGQLIAARDALGLGVEQAPEPPDALDDSLGSDDRAQDARRAVQQALDALGKAEGEDVRQAVMYAAEEAVNALVTAALDVGWRFGWTARRGGA